MFVAYGVGLCYASVCTDLSDCEAAARLNREHPTGIAASWVLSEDAAFATGEPHPCPCPDTPGCRHLLFVC